MAKSIEPKSPRQTDRKAPEHLVNYVFEDFDSAATDLDLRNAELFKQFGKCLRGNYAEHWRSVCADYAPAQRTTANFEPARQRQRLLTLIVGAGQRDTLFEFLQHELVFPTGKRDKTTPQEHLGRFMQTLQAAKKFGGTQANPTAIDTKNWYTSIRTPSSTASSTVMAESPSTIRTRPSSPPLQG